MGTHLVVRACLIAAGLTAVLGGTARAADRTLAQWTFAAPGGAAEWAHNDDLTDVRCTPDGLHVRAVGGDPILVLVPTIDVPATPWQAVEIRVRASRPGLCELFWTNTTEDPNGGFRGELRTVFGLNGDGTWRTVRLLPFWQRLGTLRRLRLDVYNGAEFDIASIKVVEFAAPTHRADTGALPRDAVVPTHNCTAVRTPGGLRLQRQAGDGAAVLAAPAAEATDRPLVAITMAARGANRCTLLYGADGAFGLQARSFAVEPDGKPRTYYVDMLGAPAWAGRVVAIGVRPGGAPPTEVTVAGLKLVDRPEGPPDIRVDWMGVEETTPRAGQAVTVLLRASNVGGGTARGVRASIQPGQGLRRSGAQPGQPLSLAFGEECEWRWTVTGAGPGSRAWTARITAQGMPAVVARGTVSLSAARPTVVRVGPPAPVRGKLDVGVYYFPGWRTSGQWTPIRRFPERRPALGWYREGDVSVADWHIRWAVEHGITFFAYDWYWVKGARQLEHGLHEGYFRSPYRHLLNFCLLWANHNPPGTSSHQDCIDVVKYWLGNYFQRPEHYRIAGRPVVIIFSPYGLRADMGTDGVRAAFEAMREECRKQGVPPLYLIACVGGDVGEANAAAREGYDAITAYNWAGLGVEGEERWAPFSTLADGYMRQWQHLVDGSPIPLMPPVSGGWDSRPWHGETALVRSERTPEAFRRHLQDARRFIEANPAKTLPVALVEAWNEWGEGSYIEPHQQYGFRYLDAIRDVFVPAARTHRDMLPVDAGVRTPQVELGLVGRPKWVFTSQRLGWESGMGISAPRVVGRALTATSTADDPAFFSPALQVRASAYRVARIRLRLTPGDADERAEVAQLFWSTRSAPTSEAASVRFPVRTDGKWHEVRVPVGTNPRWRGIVTSLRLDPCNRSGVAMSISHIELLP